MWQCTYVMKVTTFATASGVTWWSIVQLIHVKKLIVREVVLYIIQIINC